MRRPNLCRETRVSGANGDRGTSIFPVQLTTRRIGNLTYPVDPYSAECADRIYIAPLRTHIEREKSNHCVIRMSGGRLPKRIVFGNLEGAVRRGRGGKKKEWTDCVQSDIRAFGIAGDWKATASKAEVWVETVTEGGRRFMAAWRKEEVDAARHRQEKR